ncbi:hypothetical protein ACFW1A_39175 [Kitasatospora sp. NPDC058965]|uniref:hypothetical protein n=1 Tax=Kitasatospora sp. NPDC058965 TaxID=3346682 RepID=UPI0036844FF4
MNGESTAAAAAGPAPEAAARRARFGALPERIRFEDMTALRDVSAGGPPTVDDPDRCWTFYSCLALDFGL